MAWSRNSKGAGCPLMDRQAENEHPSVRVQRRAVRALARIMGPWPYEALPDDREVLRRANENGASYGYTKMDVDLMADAVINITLEELNAEMDTRW